ncbi:acyl-CoA thioesterase [Gordonia crocea]|uniref:Acyl-CoA thioesterase n=1 Tax=Gordonia crocea TaxID=589162 RepID=A0A7I9UVQ1_9ACTN|nr:hotdog domain-containing protein [Gordonia crocea]GED97294.1 acyl-CoA thioesterase [Gordonia crocea]
MTDGHGQITLRFLAAPTDTASLGGAVRGGRLLNWIDKAAYACAAAWSGGYCVTAYVGNVRFSRHVSAGDLVEVAARVVYTGSSSMHLMCTVSSADPCTGEFREVSDCLVVFVALDEQRRPRPVPQWRPTTMGQIADAEAAIARIGLRKRIERELASATYSAAGTAPRATMKFLAAPTDVNWGGNAHGGRIMEWMDEAAYLCAAQWAAGDCVSAYVGGVRFYAPVHIGDMVRTRSRLLHTGRQTMHIGVEMSAADPRTGVFRETGHAIAIVAAIDAAGDATDVRPWHPVDDEDIALDAHARELIRLRREVPRAPLHVH